MGFDVARASIEALHSRLPFLDRLLSYLYFADMTVLEQSTWDEFGRGVTVVGRKGPDGPGPGVVLAAPLPRASILAGLPPESPDVRRAGILLAMAWAVASLEDADLRSPVVLVAARPDPLGSGLRSVLESLRTGSARIIATAPTGPGLVRPVLSIGVISLGIDAPVRPLQAPLRDVVTLASDTRAGQGAVAVFPALADAVREGVLDPLAINAAGGIHLAEPEELRVVAGLRSGNLSAPAGWRVETGPASVGSTGSSRDRVLVLSQALSAASDAVSEAFERTGAPVPFERVRLVDVGSSDPAGAMIAVALPPAASARDHLAAIVARLQPIPNLQASGVQVVSPVRPADGIALPSPFLDTASCLADIAPDVTALGPLPDGLSDDPPARIREWAVRCRDTLLEALASPAPRRSR